MQLLLLYYFCHFTFLPATALSLLKCYSYNSAETNVGQITTIEGTSTNKPTTTSLNILILCVINTMKHKPTQEVTQQYLKDMQCLSLSNEVLQRLCDNEKKKKRQRPCFHGHSSLSALEFLFIGVLIHIWHPSR